MTKEREQLMNEILRDVLKEDPYGASGYMHGFRAGFKAADAHPTYYQKVSNALDMLRDGRYADAEKELESLADGSASQAKDGE